MYIVPITKMPSVASITEAKTQQTVEQGSSVPFADILSQAMKNTLETQQVSNADSEKLALGEIDDLHTMMINSAKATAALEFTVELTSRAVNAYNEILRMQV